MGGASNRQVGVVIRKPDVGMPSLSCHKGVSIIVLNCNCYWQSYKLSHDDDSFNVPWPPVAECGTAPVRHKPPEGGSRSVFNLTDRYEVQREELGAQW